MAFHRRKVSWVKDNDVFSTHVTCMPSEFIRWPDPPTSSFNELRYWFIGGSTASPKLRRWAINHKVNQSSMGRQEDERSKMQSPHMPGMQWNCRLTLIYKDGHD